MTDTTEQAVNEGYVSDVLARRLEAWIRHGEAVPASVTTYDREIVNYELRELIRDAHRG